MTEKTEPATSVAQTTTEKTLTPPAVAAAQTEKGTPANTVTVNDPFKLYNSYSLALPYILGLTAVMLLAIAALVCLGTTTWSDLLFSQDWAKAHSTRWVYDRHLLMGYLSAYLCWWAVYLYSRKPEDASKDNRFRKIKTLRRLLGEYSMQWDTNSENPTRAAQGQGKTHATELEENYRQKGESSLTSIAILIVVAAIELQEVSKLLIPILDQHTFAEQAWQISLLISSLLFAIIAFIAYIVSADSLDVIFNKFSTTEVGQPITRHYYQSTINPRYWALISLITSFILLVAFYSPTAAATAIALIFCIGYTHWFPSFTTRDAHKAPYTPGIVLRVLVLLIPLLPVLFGSAIKVEPKDATLPTHSCPAEQLQTQPQARS